MSYKHESLYGTEGWPGSICDGYGSPNAHPRSATSLSDRAPQRHGLAEDAIVSNKFRGDKSHVPVAILDSLTSQQPSHVDPVLLLLNNVAAGLDEEGEELITFDGHHNQSNPWESNAVGHIDPALSAFQNNIRRAGVDSPAQAGIQRGTDVRQHMSQLHHRKLDYAHSFGDIQKQDNYPQQYTSPNGHCSGAHYPDNGRSHSHLTPSKVAASLSGHEAHPANFGHIVNIGPLSSLPGPSQLSKFARNAASATQQPCFGHHGRPHFDSRSNDLTLSPTQVERDPTLFTQASKWVPPYPDPFTIHGVDMTTGPSRSPYGPSESPARPKPSQSRPAAGKHICAEPRCQRGVRLPETFCKRHKEKWERNNAPPPEIPYLEYVKYDYARSMAYPHRREGMASRHHDPTLATHREREDDWVQGFLAAIMTPVDISDTSAAPRFEKEQQKTFNGKAYMESKGDGRYTHEWINARLRMLFHAVLVFYEGGDAVYPVGGDNGGYGRPDTSMNFHQRLCKIAEVMTENKLITMNIIEGRGVVAFVENPGRFQKRKTQNKQSNAKKDVVLNADRKNKGKAPVARVDEQSSDESDVDGNEPFDGATGASPGLDLTPSPAAPMSKKVKRQSSPKPAKSAQPRHLKKLKTRKVAKTNNSEAHGGSTGLQEQLERHAGPYSHAPLEQDPCADVFGSPPPPTQSGHTAFDHDHAPALWPPHEFLELGEDSQQEHVDLDFEAFH